MEKLKASDLRIGNLTEYGIVIGLDLECYYVEDLKYGRVGHFYSDNEPIPLTEDWLIRFGFERKEDEDNCNIDFYMFHFLVQYRTDVNEYEMYLMNRVNCESLTIIKYVHQLQNLYHALTNEEPTIKTD